MCIATIVALSYIHMQMQIIDLAYQGNQKEQQIKRLIEENGNATYKILMLKSANHLGFEMLDANSDMQFADTNDVVQIASSEEFLGENHLSAGPKLARKTNSLLNLLSFGIVAEAKTADKF
jgi:hypothetical protein